MRLKKAIIVFLALLLFGMIHTERVLSRDNQTLDKMDADEALEQELKWLKAETFVFTASKIMEEIKKAPASITVITDRQLRQMGARNLTNALERVVPSLLGITDGDRDIHIVARGEYLGLGKVLYMINGHPITEAYLGTPLHYDDLIIDNIQRIEFIRGPGSALYGANAFYGVVNVITKEAEDIDGIELTALGGSWDTQQYNLLYGKSFRDLEVVFNFNYFKTNGYRGFIAEDLQTQFDQMINIPLGFPPASLAPGRTKGDKEKFDLSLNLKFKGFTLDMKYNDQEFDSPVSSLAALVEKKTTSIKDYYFTLSYEKSIWEGIELYGKIYRDVNDFYREGQLLPPGVVGMTPTGPAIWTDGLIRVPEYESRRFGIDVQLTFKVDDTNTIVAGAIYEDQKASADSGANFLPTSDPNILIQLPSIQKRPDELVMGTETRNFKAIFLEDVWDITQEIYLVTGVRYDHYSDFGGHLSPRIGLTWEYMKDYDLKLLYGHAFRAPTFHELYGSGYANPDLDPEKIDTYEISLGAELTPSLNSRITFYHNEIEDVILWSPLEPIYQNGGSERVQGIEFEMKYDFGRGTYLEGNYSYIMPKHAIEDNFHLGKIRTNIRLSRYLNFYTDYRFLIGFNDRWPGDTKDDYPNFDLANATLIARKFLKGYENLELRVSVYNLLDEDWAAPTPPGTPFDLPMPDRNYLFEMKYSL